MSPTTRTAALLAMLAVGALIVPAGVVGVGIVLVAAAFAADAAGARRRLRLARAVPPILSRGVPSPFTVTVDANSRGRVRVRQPALPDVRVEPSEGDGRLDAQIVARRRGRHELPAVAARRRGPLGLASWLFRGDGHAEVLVFPDLPTARRLAHAVRVGRFRESSGLTRGPLGLGTEFESIRDYLPDDDIRQVNWRATARTGRPMSNQHRVEQDRDVVCLVDAGRLMSAPIGDLTRLDAAVDAVAAVGLVADVLGDRCGVVAFDHEVRRDFAPCRRGGEKVVKAVFDLEPRPLDSDYDLAFRRVGSSKRALVLLFTDLLDEAAARSLVSAVPVLARRHAVVVVSIRDPDVEAYLDCSPTSVRDVAATAVALDLLAARANVVALLASMGAAVVEAPPGQLPAACVGAYLRLKERARL